MSDRETDGRPPRKAGAGHTDRKFGGRAGSGKSGSGKSGPDKGGFGKGGFGKGAAGKGGFEKRGAGGGDRDRDRTARFGADKGAFGGPKRSFKPRGEGAEEPRGFRGKPSGSRDGGERAPGKRPYTPRGEGADARSEGRSFRKPYTPREGGERPSFGERAPGKRPYTPRGEGADARSEGRSFRKPYTPREGGERPSFGERAPGKRPYTPRGEGADARSEGRSFRKPYTPREGGERPSFGERAPGKRPYTPRGEGADARSEGRSFRKPYTPREGGERGPDRGAPRRDDRNGPRRESAARGRFVKNEETEAEGARATLGHGGGRIAKVIARAGACSRRDAELWIEEGRVAVNGKVLDSPALNVGPDDHITIDGQPLARRERTRLFLFHKPRGLVTTNSDPEGRPTIFDALPDHVPRLVSVGRLDINTEGLMLLTNDGGLARVLELPATGWLRRYRVRAHGEANQAELDKLMNGVVVEGIEYRGIEAKIDRVQGANTWLTIGLREGKNREVKRVLESIGLDVNRLIRVSYGPFQLQDLGEGALEEVGTRILKDQLGERLAQEAGADFDAPIFDRREATIEVERTGRGASERPIRGRDRDGDERRESGAERNAPGKRKHVTALREISRDKQTSGARTRIEASQTEDRRGRAVKVERRVSAREADEEIPDSRNARRFAAERDKHSRADAPPREQRFSKGPRDAGAKAGRKPEGGARRFEGKGGERGAKGGERGAKPGGRSFGKSDRPTGKGAGGGRRGDAPRGGGERPPRRPRTR